MGIANMSPKNRLASFLQSADWSAMGNRALLGAEETIRNKAEALGLTVRVRINPYWYENDNTPCGVFEEGRRWGNRHHEVRQWPTSAKVGDIHTDVSGHRWQVVLNHHENPNLGHRVPGMGILVLVKLD